MKGEEPLIMMRCNINIMLRSGFAFAFLFTLTLFALGLVVEQCDG